MRAPTLLFASLALAACCLAAGAGTAWHPNSRSQTELRVSDGLVRARVRCQVESVVEVFEVDTDGNGLVDEAEFEPQREAIGAYILEHYRLLAGEADDAPPRPGRVLDVRLHTEDLDALYFLQFVDVELSWELDAPLAAVDVEMDLFTVTSPRHTDTGRVLWPGGEVSDYRLWGGRPRTHLTAPPRPPAPSLVDDLHAGARAVWGGARHLVFVLALLVAAPRLRTFALLLAAFVVMACVAGVFVAQRVVDPAPESLQLGVALSLVWLGGLTTLRRTVRPPWAEALLFGLLHGASVVRLGTLAHPLPGDDVARVGVFLVGGVAVWVALAAAALLVLRPLPRRPSRASGPRDTQLVPGYARDAVSLGAALVGTWWAASQLAV